MCRAMLNLTVRKGPVLFPGLARFNIQDGGRTVYENVDCVD